MKISIVATAYNDVHNATGLYASIAAQTVQPHEVIVVDNSDTTPVADAVLEQYPGAIILSHPENLDFSKGSNTGIARATGDLVLLLNSDMELEPDCLERLLAFMEEHSEYGVVTPLLMRKGEGTIDTLGLAGNRSRRFVNIAAGEDRDSIDVPSQAPGFGISGTAILFRRSAINTLIEFGGGEEGELFDNDFIAYKDDIDLSYRLHHAGIQFAVVADSVAYHVRTAQERKPNEGLFAARGGKSHRINTYSYRNHLWTLLKNEPLSNLMLHSPFILFYECQKMIFMLLFERRTLSVLPSFFRGLPVILAKRKQILQNSRTSAKKLRALLK